MSTQSVTEREREREREREEGGRESETDFVTHDILQREGKGSHQIEQLDTTSFMQLGNKAILSIAGRTLLGLPVT